MSGSSGDDSETRSKSSNFAPRGAVQSPSLSGQGSSSQTGQSASRANAVTNGQRKPSSSSATSKSTDANHLLVGNVGKETTQNITQKTVTETTRNVLVAAPTAVSGTNHPVNNANNTSGNPYNGGAYNVSGGAYNVSGGAYSAGGGAYNAGGGAYNVGGGAFYVGGDPCNYISSAFAAGISTGSFNTGADAYSLNAPTPVVTTGERRKGRVRQEQVRLPDQAQGRVRQVRQRLPTPEPDTIERTLIQRAPAEIVEEITEIPTTPPPIIKERTVVEPAGPPQVTRRTVRVPPRSGGVQQQTASAVGPVSGTQLNFGTSATTQQFHSGYQQQSIPNYGTQQQVVPPAGCHPAFCFYL